MLLFSTPPAVLGAFELYGMGLGDWWPRGTNAAKFEVYDMACVIISTYMGVWCHTKSQIVSARYPKKKHAHQTD